MVKKSLIFSNDISQENDLRTSNMEPKMHTCRKRLVNFGHSSFNISKEQQLLKSIRNKNFSTDKTSEGLKTTLTTSRKKGYLKFRKHKLKQARSTSFKFADRERFNDDKWKQRAAGGMKTFLILAQPTQFRFCSKRLACSIGSWMFSSECMEDEV